MTTTDTDLVAGSAPAAKRDSFITRLTTGTGAFDILGPRKIYYWVGIGLVVASILLIVIRGFNFGIDFVGGTKLAFTPDPGQSLSSDQVAAVVEKATGAGATVQTVGSGIQVSTETLTPEQITAAKAALTSGLNLNGSVSASAVSETWGQEVSSQALISVIVFLIAVALFIWIRYERRAAVAAVASTIQVMIITAGVYSLVGFEVSPATVIGLLTILGFSLYDTVVVFDKVEENTKGLTSLTRRTYTEAANLAVNQTLMRSINTSLIALLPVAGLLVAGVAILGSGTLKDLALVQLVGMLVGAYSSLFVAVPLAVDLRLREPAIKAHTARVAAKRKSEGLVVDAVGDPISRSTPIATGRQVAARPAAAAAAVAAGLKPGAPPKPGARPIRSSAKPAAPSRTPSTRVAPVAAPPVVAPVAPVEAVVVEPVEPVAPPVDSPAPAAKGKPAPRPTGKGARPTGKRGR